MLKVLFSDGVDVYSADLDALETYREVETERRWIHQVETSGIKAKSYSDNILMPSTGGSAGTIAVSAGGAYTPGGEYVYCTGASLTGLTDADMFSGGTTYIAVQYYRRTGDTRSHMIGENLYPTREWNASDANCLALVNAATGDTFVVLGVVTSISAGGDVVLDTGSTYRTLMRMSSVAPPTTPGGLTVVTGPETDLIHSGVTRAQRVESTLAYVSLSWDASTHTDGILGYYARLDILNDDDSIATGKSLSQILYVGSGDTTPSYTGITFHNLTPGLKAQVSVYSLSNAAIPIASIPATGAAFYIGSGASLTMPVLAIVQRAGGCEVTWDPTDAGVSNSVLFEVFASGSSAFTGATVDYTSMVYRGYGKRAFIPGDIGDSVYIKVRGVGYDGRVSAVVTTSTTLTGPSAPPAPVEVRLAGLRFPELSDLECSDSYKANNFSVAMKGGVFSDRAVTVWEWNWSNLIGVGAPDGVFSVTSNGSGITVGSLVGTYLWLNSNTTDYIITANTAADAAGKLVISVSDLLGQPVDLTGEAGTSNNPAVVHCRADEYEVEFREYSDDGNNSELPSKRIQRSITQSESPLPQTLEVILPLGSRQQCVVWSKERNTRNSSTGTTSDIERIAYEEISLWNSFGTVTALGTEYGFEITLGPGAVLDLITGWEIAHHLGTSGVSFTNPTHNSQVYPPNDTFRFATERGGTYEIGVRPLVGGMVAGDQKTIRVASGGGGYLPNTKSYVVNVDLRPINQLLEYDTGTTQVKISGESGTAISAVNPASIVNGNKFLCAASGNTYVFKVRNQRNAYDSDAAQIRSVLEIQEITSFGTTKEDLFPTGVGLTAYFGGLSSTATTLQQIRELARIPVPNEITVTRLLFKPDYTDATDVSPAIIRVYQDGLSVNAVSMEVAGITDTVIEQDVDLSINYAGGNLTMVVDAFDPDVASRNIKWLIGRLEIEYRDAAVKTSVSTAGAGGFSV